MEYVYLRIMRRTIGVHAACLSLCSSLLTYTSNPIATLMLMALAVCGSVAGGADFAMFISDAGGDWHYVDICSGFG